MSKEYPWDKLWVLKSVTGLYAVTENTFLGTKIKRWDGDIRASSMFGPGFFQWDEGRDLERKHAGYAKLVEVKVVEAK